MLVEFRVCWSRSAPAAFTTCTLLGLNVHTCACMDMHVAALRAELYAHCFLYKCTSPCACTDLHIVIIAPAGLLRVVADGILRTVRAGQGVMVVCHTGPC